MRNIQFLSKETVDYCRLFGLLTAIVLFLGINSPGAVKPAIE